MFEGTLDVSVLGSGCGTLDRVVDADTREPSAFFTVSFLPIKYENEGMEAGFGLYYNKKKNN